MVNEHQGFDAEKDLRRMEDREREIFDTVSVSQPLTVLYEYVL